MSWGDSWGRRPGQAAKDVAEAFYAGRALSRTNCDTDGESYRLDGAMIACRVKPEDEPEQIKLALMGKPFRRSLEFSFRGRNDRAVCRHLRALGVECDITWECTKNAFGGRVRTPVFLMRGRKVASINWYTLEELAEMPEWKPPAKPVRIIEPDLTKLTNLELDFA